MRTNIAAYTAPGSFYPAYISINEVNDTLIEITVRPPAHDGKCGEPVAMTMNRTQAKRMFTEALEVLG